MITLLITITFKMVALAIAALIWIVSRIFMLIAIPVKALVVDPIRYRPDKATKKRQKELLKQLHQSQGTNTTANKKDSK